jgi:peptide/nickel transport system substrate-binding protein
LRNKSLVTIICICTFILILTSVLLVGCKSTTTTSSTTAAPTTKATTTVATTAATTVAATTTATVKPTATTAPPTTPAIKKGGTLKIAIPQDAMILGDPMETRMTGFVMQRAAIEFLGRFDSKGFLQPWLADSWTEDPANLTFTVKLKQGIKFHDGTDFNAEAVKWNWQRFITGKSGYTTKIDTIEVKDTYTVVAHLKAWDNACPYNLCYWAGGEASPTAWQQHDDKWGALNPVGTGPFKFVSWVAESKITFAKFDGYWQKGKPNLDGIQFVIIPDDTTRSAAFQAGEVDEIFNAPAAQANTLAKMNKYVVQPCKTGIGTNILMLSFDAGNANSQFTDLKVRQAVAYALDKKAIVDATLFGYGFAANQMGAPDNWGYNPDITGFPYNVAKAKSLLAEAGKSNLNTKLTTMQGTEATFTAIQGMLADAGITATLNVVSPGAWYQIASAQGWEGILQMPSPPDGDVSTRFNFTTTPNKMGISQLRPAENDKLVLQMTSAGTFAEKQALTRAYQKRIFQDIVMAVPLYVSDTIAVKYPYVKGDNFCTNSGHEWTPEDSWLDK